MCRSILTAALYLLAACTTFNLWAAAPSASVPMYKPSGRSPEPVAILTNAYGASRNAPNALELGDRAPDFELARAGGGTVSLQALRTKGDVAIIFYRGHW